MCDATGAATKNSCPAHKNSSYHCNNDCMNLKRKNPTTFLLVIFFLCSICKTSAQVLDRNKLAKEYYHEDARWFLDNTPFFECSDKQVEQVYYYRWKMYKAHIRNVGQ